MATVAHRTHICRKETLDLKKNLVNVSRSSKSKTVNLKGFECQVNYNTT